MRNIKGQVSTELMIIVAVILILFIPLIIVTYFKASEASEQIAELQSQIIAIRLAELSNSLGSAGGNSSIITEIFIPSNVASINITGIENGGEITVRSITKNGPSEISGLVRFKIKNAAFSFSAPGLVRFELSKDEEGFVVIKKL